MIKNFYGFQFHGSKEQLIEQEQQLNVAKQRFREAQDELEELRALLQDQQGQLDDYRNKVKIHQIFSSLVSQPLFSTYKPSNKSKNKGAKSI